MLTRKTHSSGFSTPPKSPSNILINKQISFIEGYFGTNSKEAFVQDDSSDEMDFILVSLTPPSEENTPSRENSPNKQLQPKVSIEKIEVDKPPTLSPPQSPQKIEKITNPELENKVIETALNPEENLEKEEKKTNNESSLVWNVAVFGAAVTLIAVCGTVNFALESVKKVRSYPGNLDGKDLN